MQRAKSGDKHDQPIISPGEDDNATASRSLLSERHRHISIPSPDQFAFITFAASPFTSIKSQSPRYSIISGYHGSDLQSLVQNFGRLELHQSPTAEGIPALTLRGYTPANFASFKSLVPRFTPRLLMARLDSSQSPIFPECNTMEELPRSTCSRSLFFLVCQR